MIPEFIVIDDSKLLEAYIQERKKTHPYVQANNQVQDAVKKAGVICRKLKVDPVVYVRAQMWAVRGRDFFHTDLFTKNAETNYKKYIELHQSELEDSFRVQMQYLKSSLSVAGRTLERVLVNDNIDFSPWFRIVISREEIPEVSAKYGAAAKSQLTEKLITFLKKKGLDTERIKQLHGY